jgi:hypothetical protein
LAPKQLHLYCYFLLGQKKVTKESLSEIPACPMSSQKAGRESRNPYLGQNNVGCDSGHHGIFMHRTPESQSKVCLATAPAVDFGMRSACQLLEDP